LQQVERLPLAAVTRQVLAETRHHLLMSEPPSLRYPLFTCRRHRFYTRYR
jgi:hypothetical protein